MLSAYATSGGRRKRSTARPSWHAQTSSRSTGMRFSTFRGCVPSISGTTKHSRSRVAWITFRTISIVLDTGFSSQPPFRRYFWSNLSNTKVPDTNTKLKLKDVGSRDTTPSPSKSKASKSSLRTYGELVRSTYSGNYDRFISECSERELASLIPGCNANAGGVDVLALLVIFSLYYFESDYAPVINDPLVRLLLDEPPNYKLDFTIVSAMGVVTEGTKGLELSNSFQRVFALRGVRVIR